MKIKTKIFILLIALLGFYSTEMYAHFGTSHVETTLPLSLDGYNDHNIDGLWNKLVHRIEFSPYNLIATLIFFLAIAHTFLAGYFQKLSEHFAKKHETYLKLNPSLHPNTVCYKAEIFHFLGEVEAVFGIWVVPLACATIFYYDWTTFVDYIDYKVNYLEPVFVVIIMAIASSRPILILSENCLKRVACLGRCSPTAWWFSILTIAPILGSFITEPAAMTIAALLLSKQFYNIKPSSKLCYATLGVLFVNISVGGTLTHFAAPPVLMVAGTWDWDMAFMFTHFGWKSAMGIVISNIIYFIIFRKEFSELNQKHKEEQESLKKAIAGAEINTEHKVPFVITCIHLLFLVWTVLNLHHLPLFMGGFLFFLAFTHITLHHQYQLKLRTPLLVGFFLAGLVTHGGLQQWWIQPVLDSLSPIPLFIGSTILTAFNDNAAITFLASLVPDFANNLELQKAVVSGAVAGGGLTIIANAPNPAGRSILAHHFKDGLSPVKLFAGALLPTIVVSCCLMLTP